MPKFKDFEWEEGRRFELCIPSYRHALSIVCAKSGRHTAEFSNGSFPYFALLGFSSGTEGVVIVPVLPDGKFLMVIEERPAIRFFENDARMFRRSEGDIRLENYEWAEFPAGGVKKGESPRDAGLRELSEETGVPDQEIELFIARPLFPLISDVVLRSHVMVAFLSDTRFSSRVENDGGLTVCSLAEKDIDRNIRSGVLADMGTALVPWQFYKTVMAAKKNPELMEQYKKEGYFVSEKVAFPKQRSQKKFQ